MDIARSCRSLKVSAVRAYDREIEAPPQNPVYAVSTRVGYDYGDGDGDGDGE